MATIRLNINGKERDVETEEDIPLLWFLRDHLDLTGTKFGCGMAMCGACTVLVDGKAVRSCSTPAAGLQGREIITIEGLEEAGGKVLQDAWYEHDVPQCGYCQAGQIMNAAALLRENSNPSNEEIDKAMNGNICRCGSYTRIKAAIQTAVKNGGVS